MSSFLVDRCHLAIVVVCFSRLSLDDIVGEVFDKIAQYVVLGGEPRWKEVQRFFRGGPSSEKSGAPDTASQEDTISPDNSASHVRSMLHLTLTIKRFE